MKMDYFDPKAETRLEAYADTVVLEREGNVPYIAAIRFGGYPESVKGMSDAIYGGGCGSLLWTALLPERQSEWVKVSKFGFVHRRHAHEYLEGLAKKPALLDAVQAIADNPDGHFPNMGAYRRFPLSTYIKRQMKGKIDGLIVDELHNYKGISVSNTLRLLPVCRRAAIMLLALLVRLSTIVSKIPSILRAGLICRLTFVTDPISSFKPFAER